MDTLKIIIEDLRPTQKCVGLIEVESKVKKLSHLTHGERDLFVQDNPIPAVLGYHKHFYIIDHHHLARALLDAGHHHARIKIIEELSYMDQKEFWNSLHKKELIYLKDSKGSDISPDDLPKKVSDLKDDPYRSLAGFVRRAGGFDKNPTPFSEFKWAEFFRHRIKFENNIKGLEKVLSKAIELAKSPEAQNLPGFKNSLD